MPINLNSVLWVGLGILVIGSAYLIFEGYRVHKLFTDSIIGKLVKTLVIVVLIELYSLGVASFAFISFSPKGIPVLLPIIGLWILCLFYSIYAIRSTRRDVGKL